MTTKLKVFLCLVFTMALLTGCACSHQWQEATCMAPKTCSRCGETEGKIRSHKWGNTDCSSAEGCIFCGTMEGIELSHQYPADSRICIHCGHDDRPADDRFLDQLVLGLEERLDLINQVETRIRATREDYMFRAEVDAAKTLEDWTAFIDAEYNRLASFREDSFLDPELEAVAKRYVNSVAESKELLSAFGTEEWDERYINGVYHAQQEALYQISGLRTVTVREDLQPKLQDLLNHGEIIQMANQLFDQVLFLNIKTKNNEWTYETTVKNTSSLTYEYFTFEIDLVDENDNIVATETSTAKNWRPGQEVRFNFVTTELFHAIRVDSANWKIAVK